MERGITMRKIILTIVLLFFCTDVIGVYAKESNSEEAVYLRNSDGIEISKEEYDKLSVRYSKSEIDKMSYSELKNLQDPNIKLIDKQVMYIKTDVYKDLLGNNKIVNSLVRPEDVQNQLAKINSSILSKESSIQSIYGSTHTTAMKKLEIEAYKDSSGTSNIATMTNTWLSLPSVRSLDVIAIRFGAINNLSVLKYENATYAEQIWDGNIIKYGSDSNKMKIKTSGASSSKSGVGVTMNLKDDASKSLKCYLEVAYTTTNQYSYSVYGTYQHATANVSDTDYNFSPNGMGGVLEFNKNSSIYDNTSGVTVLGER